MAWLLMITFLFILGLVVQSAIAFSSIRRNVKIDSHLDTKLKLKSSTTLNDIPTQYRVDNTQLKSTTLNDIPTKSTQQPIEKVAIIGAGISGLSLAHALRSTNLMNDDVNATPIQIDIFDSRQDLDEKSGSGIQLTGGIAALRKISPKLQRQVSDASIPLQKVVSTCRPWFGSNDTNDSWKIFELDLQQAITERDAADKEEAAENGGIENKQIDGLVAEDGEILAYTILRGTLQRIMQTELSKEHDIYIQFDKRLCDISNKEGEGITCQFTDGTQTSGYDLIIGCDGIQSAVRQYVNNGSIQAKKKEAAIYSGLRITFAIQEDAIDADEVCTFTQHFGNGAYALTSTYGAGKDESRAKGAFLVYPDENYIGPFKRQKPAEEDSIGTSKTTSIDEAKTLDENVDWTQNKRIPKDKIQECLKILQTSSIPGNDVANIVGKADRFFDLGVYFYNPFTFNGWVREIKASNSKDDNPKFAVLTGDAAHAMPPFLGQGANQAMQDSCVLAAKIFEYNSQVSSTSSSEADLKALLKEYENRRWLPTTSITVKAALLGYLEVGPSLFSNFRDVFFLVMGKIGVAKKVFLDSAFPKM